MNKLTLLIVNTRDIFTFYNWRYDYYYCYKWINDCDTSDDYMTDEVMSDKDQSDNI